jgi:hypothetical protein
MKTYAQKFLPTLTGQGDADEVNTGPLRATKSFLTTMQQNENDPQKILKIDPKPTLVRDPIVLACL